MRLSACQWLACLICLALPAAAPAQDYLPLGPGSYWHYAGEAGDAFSRTVTGTIEMAGQAVSVVATSGYDPDDGLEQYYTAGEGGDVLLWGFYRNLEDWGLLYVPPLRIVDAPLSLGQRWSVVADCFEIPGNHPAGTLVGERVVQSEGLESVPAGEFFARAIAWDLRGEPLRALASHGCDPSGRRLAPGRELSPPEYWTLGVGIIREETTQIWRLTDFDGPTPSGAQSWSAIKALY
ncbi:hypothetical protein FJ251_13490 [bacterium]|nr:hypothetical protein [bacterium]